MKEETVDRRIRRTRKVLKECLTKLLKEKKIQEITVRELTEMADINRGTFYLHYRDVFDLMEQIEQELIDEAEEILTRYHTSDVVAKPSLLLSELFRIVRENADIAAILVGENGDLNFVNRLTQTLREHCLQNWLDMKCPGDPAYLGAFSAYIVSGCIGIVRYWLETGMKETPKQMAQLSEDFIVHGLRVLEQQA